MQSIRIIYVALQCIDPDRDGTTTEQKRNFTRVNVPIRLNFGSAIILII